MEIIVGQLNNRDMTSTEKTVLHYRVIANMGHTIEKIANDLANLNTASYANIDKIRLRKQHLAKYFSELARLVQEEQY
jgi:hypothetical protein